jgi:Fe2+ or Zn2+ uptake regulation protein
METTPDILRRALDVLVDARIIERRELPDGRSVFGRVSTDPDNRHQ